MLNAGGNPSALREPRPLKPTPPPLPVAPVGNAANAGWSGGSVQFQVLSHTVVAPAPVRSTKPKFDRTHLRHPDVYLPLIAAAIVVLILLAWAP